MKTTLACDLALSLAIACPYLGWFRIQRAVRVAMMSGESGLAVLQETLRRIADAAGRRLADVSNLIVSDQLPVFGDLRHIDALGDFLTGDEIEVLILDPAYLCMPTNGGEGSVFVMGPLLGSISELCQQTGTTLILLHHTKRGVADPFAPPELADLAWSGFAEFARQWILLGRRERYEPGSGNHRLWMNCGGSAGHSNLWALDIAEGAYDGDTPRRWEVIVSKADEVRREATERKEEAKRQKQEEKRQVELEVNMRAIVDMLAKIPGGDTKTVIKTRLGLRDDRLYPAIAELTKKESIKPTTIVKAGKSYEGFRLSNDDTPAPKPAQESKEKPKPTKRKKIRNRTPGQKRKKALSGSTCNERNDPDTDAPM